MWRFRGVWLLEGVWIGWLDLLNLYTVLGTTVNYSGISNLHNSQFTKTPVKPFPACCVFTSRSLATALTVEVLQLPALRSFLRRLSLRTAWKLFPQLNWIPISSQPPSQSSTALSTTKPHLSSFIATVHGPIENIVSNNTSIVTCVFVAAGNVFTEPLPSNKRILSLHYSGCHNKKTWTFTPTNISGVMLWKKIPQYQK
jgi:hypothetical protein